MADPAGLIEGWIGRNSAIIVGLTIGTAAKYGLTLTEGRKLSWRGVIADLLLLGMLGLLAVTVADWCSLTGNARVLVGALSAVSSDRLIRLARDRFLKRVEDELSTTVAASPATATEVPAGVGLPEAVRLLPGTEDKPIARAGAALRGAFRDTTRRRPPADQIEALRRLDTPSE